MQTGPKNPYNWHSSRPRVEISQPEITEVAETLAEGGSTLVLGGRGMGKSVFLRQLHDQLARRPLLDIVVVSGPPPQLDVRSCLEQLADVLSVHVDGYLDTARIVDTWFARQAANQRLVLLFDEFDRYAESDGQLSPNPPGRGFFNNLEITRRNREKLGILAAGSVGVFAFRDALGSSFLSRAEHRSLKPFDRAAVTWLARPLTERGLTLSDEVFDALLLATGGVPALVIYGLQELWKLPRAVDERDITRIYFEFQQRHHGYINDVHKAFADPDLSAAPQRVLEHFRQGTSDLKRSTLEAVCQGTNNPLGLSLSDVLLVLEAAGLLKLESSAFAGDPVRGHAIPSLLNLPTTSREASGFSDRLRRDLELLLGKLHQASVDFFRPGPAAGQKRLLPESVFAAHLALGFELLGWRAEREAQSVAGRTDLKLRYNGDDQVAVIEVKIWGRHGAKQAQRQVEGYWTSHVAAGAVVQITDTAPAAWPESYREEALEDVDTVELVPLDATPIQACFAVSSEISSGLTAEVTHYLLRLPRR